MKNEGCRFGAVGLTALKYLRKGGSLASDIEELNDKRRVHTCLYQYKTDRAAIPLPTTTSGKRSNATALSPSDSSAQLKDQAYVQQSGCLRSSEGM